MDHMEHMEHDPQALPAGKVIAGYRVVRVLGAGGFGITYEGESAVIDRRVAIKELFPRGIATREAATRLVYASRDAELVAWALDRFERSSAELCRLKHPSIVEVIHYVKENDTGYMIMEYVEGQTLESWLRKRPAPPSPAELRPVIDPILDALAYVHAGGLIHRDVAPDNIMIRPDGRPVLIDFGAIKAIEQRTSTRTFLVAKPSYSPPEQTEDGVHLEQTADVYAAGAVLYRAYAGAPPVDAEKRKQGMLFRRADPYVPLARAAAIALPAGVIATIDSALAFYPEERPQSIDALRAGLDWREGAPTEPGLADGANARADALESAIRGELTSRNLAPSRAGRSEQGDGDVAARSGQGAQPEPRRIDSLDKATRRSSRRVAAAVVVGLCIVLGAAAMAYWQRDRFTTSLDVGPIQPRDAATIPKVTDRVAQPDGPATKPPAAASDIAVAKTPPARADVPIVAPAGRSSVVLYEEDPADKQGKRYAGSATWRTETVTPRPGAAPELAVRADIEIPDRRITMTVSFRRNTDAALPASHTFEFMFNLPTPFPPGGIANVPGILMKTGEQTRGAPLAGLAVKVTANFFLLGLSSTEADMRSNLTLLKERGWLDIPIIYSDNRRAILAVEKGSSGERSFKDAFAAWRQ